jgi:DUF1365 family protein
MQNNLVFSSSLLKTTVYHKRYRPIIYDFSHKIFYLIMNLNDVKFDDKTKFLSINKFNLFSLFWKDYGFAKFDDPKEYINQTLNSFNFDSKIIENISLITIPRIFGYSFNPVSFWLCFDKQNSLRIVLAEVNNTFKERHGYLCFNNDMTPISSKDTINRQKIFHVSPFCEVSGEYYFRFDINEKQINIDIDYYQDNKKLIATNIRAKKTILSDWNLIYYFFAYPFMIFKVVFLIHYHAFWLWIKKVKYIKKPSKPKNDIT